MLEMRRADPYWGPRRMAFELARKRYRLVALRVSRLSLSGSGRPGLLGLDSTHVLLEFHAGRIRHRVAFTDGWMTDLTIKGCKGRI